MRFPQDVFLSKRRKNQIRPKKKQKKLDAICERTYSENRVKIESPGMSEVNGDTSEIRRSSRVRRAPCVLDASPLPPKKRRKTEWCGGRGSSGLKAEERRLNSVGVEEEELGEWKARLRDRGRKMKFATDHSSPKSKKKLFGRSDGKEQSDLVGKTLMVVKSKRPGRVKASSGVSNVDLGLGSSDKEMDDTSDLQVVRDENKGSLLEEGVTDNGAVVESPEQEKEVSSSSDSEDSSKNTVDSVEKSLQAEQAESGEKENHSLHPEVTSVPGDLVVNDSVNANHLQGENSKKVAVPGDANHLQDENSKKVSVPGDANHLQEENSKKVGEYKYSPSHRQHKSQIKKGRYCDLCGGGNEGKPPRKLLHDGAGSDNEAYSGSSSSEEPTYDTLDGFGDEPGWLGQLLGPINDRYGIAGIWVHQHCAVWSPEVYFAGLGCLKNVR